MGVHNLWELLLPIGRRISMESLEGKILAIDASIWLTQFLSVAQKLQEQRDNGEFNNRETVHYLANTLKRLCKLRYQGIRPVLVFDGATPEIKMNEVQRRRKQRNKRKLDDDFTTSDDYERAAKRLLSKNLIKGANGKLMLKASAANNKAEQEEDAQLQKEMAEFEKHYHDPAAAERRRQKDDEMLAKKLQEQEWASSNAEQKEQEIIDLLEDDAYLEGGELLEAQNDWDAVDTSHDKEQTGGETTDSKETSRRSTSGSNRLPNNAHHPGRPKQKQLALDLSSYHAGDGTGFAVEDVAHLNPDERTEVIEDAKKNRYLASRKEYMKVAYDPQGLSQVQLRNFLKHTKLNQDISNMAKQAAKMAEKEALQNSTSNEVGTIIFEKVDEPEESNDAFMQRPRPTAKQKQEQLERFKAQRLSVLQDTDDEGSDNDGKHDDDDWRGNKKAHQWGDTYFRRPAVLDDDDEEEEKKESSTIIRRHAKSAGGFFVPVTETMQQAAEQKQLSPSKPHKRIQLKDDEDEDEIVDLANDDDNDSVEDVTPRSKPAAKSDAAIAQDMNDEALARALQEQEDGGGGFVVDANTTSNKTNNTVKNAQNQQDEALARALQESSETAGGGGFLPPDDPEVQVEKTVITIDSDNEENDDADKKPEAKQAPKSQAVNDAALAKSLQELEYEDGTTGGGLLPSNPNPAKETVDLTVDKSTAVALQNASEDPEEDDVDWEDGEEEADGAAEVADSKDNSSLLNESANESRSDKTEEQDQALSKQQAGSTIGDGEVSDPDEDDVVDWEDGGDDQAATTDEVKSASKPLADDNEIDDGIMQIDRFQGNDWEDATSSPSKSRELSAALEQAQATAANLTNWAGRAFRRAIAENAMENGVEVHESAKPKALSNDEKEQDEEQLAFEDSLAVQHKQRAKSSTTSNAERKPAASTANSTAKRSFDFLDTVPTADEYATRNASTNGTGNNASTDPFESGGVTEEMRNEVMQLLRLFGIPYVVAPAEAEAQCVELERLGLVDGVVTEDSDAFVFGGKIVYKNLFKDQKYVEAYHSEDAKDEMNLTRDALVALAMLLGGDYTEGIKGVGMVNAMEILLAFDVAEDCKDGLTRFRKWLDGFDPADLVKGGDSKAKDIGVSDEFHRKHRTARNRWVAPKYFPDDKVLNAYWHPVVDNSDERFSWGEPDLDGLVVFCNKQLGWPAEQTKALINPIVERLQQSTMRQTRLDSFMKYEDGLKFAEIRSKRLQSVLKATVDKKKSGKASEKDQESTDE